MPLDLDRLAADVEAALLSRGGKVKGAEIVCRCPNPDHEDTDPSCRYHRQKRAYTCDPCGAGGGLAVGDQPLAPMLGFDLDDYQSANGNGNGRGYETRWEIRDADGKVVATHHRIDRPDGKVDRWWSRNGSNSLNGRKVATLPLYGCHRLGDREPGDDTPVIVVEGEKAADALINAGMVAVGTVTGAKGIPAGDVLEALRDRHVVLWADNDDVGREHMRRIAALLQGVASTVRVFEPGGLPKGGDAVEWLQAHDAADLLEAIELGAAEPSETIADDAPSDDMAISVDDFYGYMPMHRYIHTPSGDMWPSTSINARIAPIQVGDETITASRWIDQHRPVEQMTWSPGAPTLIEDRLLVDGGWIDHRGVRVFNLYNPPRIQRGDASKAGPWIEHADRLFPDDDVAEHVVSWLAHRVQTPGEKINHALVIGGLQGIGKDTLLEPVKHAIGAWNFGEIGPTQLLGRFNPWVRSVVLRISEARDLGDIDRYSFYERLKGYTAAPPDVLRVDEKYINEHLVANVVGVIITTNHKSNGIYLPADDRRHFVAWSSVRKDDFPAGYWQKFYAWYEAEGNAHVAAYLAELDLSAFDPKAPPPKTPAFWDIVAAGQAPEDAELADALDALANPDAVTIAQIVGAADTGFADWLKDRRNARQIPHRFEECGYVSVRNPAAKDGLWKVGRRRQVVYAKHDLNRRDQIAAAGELVERIRYDDVV